MEDKIIKKQQEEEQLSIQKIQEQKRLKSKEDDQNQEVSLKQNIQQQAESKQNVWDNIKNVFVICLFGSLFVGMYFLPSMDFYWGLFL